MLQAPIKFSITFEGICRCVYLKLIKQNNKDVSNIFSFWQQKESSNYFDAYTIVYCATRRKKLANYNSKSTGHAFVAGFVLSILVKNSYILGRDPFMLKKY